MLIRTNILPKTLQDAAVTTFVIFIVPIIYWFELFIVLPTFYDYWTASYIFHFTTGTFILLNITSNMLAVMLCDTSIKGKILSSDLQQNWRLCATCETLSPPRSWHCNICNTCILKRDHHCIFTSCCIGHHNYRYFLMFVFYIFAATIYATYYNTYFISTFMEFKSWVTVVKIFFPLAMIFIDSSPNQLYLFLYLIVFIAVLFTGVLFYFHVDLMLRGFVTHERNSKLNEYDLGRLENIKAALGKKWYLIWLSPFITSELTHDGIHWETKQSTKGK